MRNDLQFRIGSQNQKILDYLLTGKSLTVELARNLGYGSNLRSRISNIKDKGYIIESKQIKIPNGYVAEYTLVKHTKEQKDEQL